MTKVEVWMDLSKELQEAIDKFGEANFECGEYDSRWSDGTYEEAHEAAEAAKNGLVAEIIKAIQAAAKDGFLEGMGQGVEQADQP